jgi:glucose-6-phosphate 1-dehydrogenase
MQTTHNLSSTIVLFGATGDLAKRKLYPALFNLYKKRLLPEKFTIIGVARKSWTKADFQEHVLASLNEFADLEPSQRSLWDNFSSHLEYTALDLTSQDGYMSLKSNMDRLEERLDLPGDRLYYLAIAPELFQTVTDNLKSSGLHEPRGSKRLVIEKPFGHDYESAQALNQTIQTVFEEEEIYRIDHYLGKEMVQNIEVIRFANSFFEPIWNSKHIDNIQITSSETVGVEERGSYYELAGALRDMVQNHMLQMITMVAMEPPSRLVTEAIRDEKVKVLRSLRRFSSHEVAENVIRGQYSEGSIGAAKVTGYQQEAGVSKESVTETFVAARLYIDNFRWAGVPFYIRTGKRMPIKSTEIVIQFKELPKNLYFNKDRNLEPNLLRISIYPEEGISFQLNAKKPGNEGLVIPISMNFCQNCEIGTNSPEAYERLLYDCIHGDSTFFTRWDEVALAWKFVDPISHMWQEQQDVLYKYPAGSWGPARANELLVQDQTHWWPVSAGVSVPGTPVLIEDRSLVGVMPSQ